MPRVPAPAPIPPAEAVKALLASGETYATTMLTLVIDRWGTEALSWHPGVLRDELESEFSCPLPQIALDRLMAGIAILTSDVFWKDVGRFIQLANVLAGHEFSPEVFDTADAVECAWAITEALLLDPPEDGEEPFSSEVQTYIAHVLKEEGFVTPPDVLKIAVGADLSQQVSTDYSDDPELFSGLYQTQQGKTDEVSDLMRENLLKLLEQLRSLPLEHGNVSKLEERIAHLSRRT